MASKMSMESMIAAVCSSVVNLRGKDDFDNCRTVCIEARALMSAADEEVLFSRSVDERWRMPAQEALSDAIKALTDSAYAEQCTKLIYLTEERMNNFREMTVENVESRLSAIA